MTRDKRKYPLLTEPIEITRKEFRQLVEFVRNGLLDPRAQPAVLLHLTPDAVPSGRPVFVFE